MTALPNNDRTVRLAPSAGATTLAYDFWIARAEDLAVWRVRAGTSTLLTLTTDYSVSGAGADAGGTVTLATAAQAGDAYVLAGSWQIQQVLDLITAGDFRAEDVDHQHRLILAALMEIRRDLAVTVRVPVHDEAGPHQAGGRGVAGLTYLELSETSVTVPASDKLRLYAKDVDGITKLFARSPTADVDLSGAGEAAVAAAASAAAAAASAGTASSASAAAVAAAASLALPPLAGGALKTLRVNAGETAYELTAAGSGDVSGPANALDGELAEFSGTTGKAIKKGGVVVTAAAKTLLDDASVSAMRETLELSRMPHGGCELVLSGGSLLLRPRNGNGLIVNNLFRTVPSAGVTLAATGLTPGTTYYVYAYWTGSAIALEASTTGHATDSGNGVEIKSGDASRTLVGMARPVTGPAWVDSATQRFVRSWFNRAALRLENIFTAFRETASTSFVELNTEIRCEFLAWADDVVQGGGNGVVWYTSATYSYVDTAFAFDGNAEQISSAYVNNSAALPAFAATVTKSGLSEGYHYVTLLGRVASGAASGRWGDGVKRVGINLSIR